MRGGAEVRRLPLTGESIPLLGFWYLQGGRFSWNELQGLALACFSFLRCLVCLDGFVACAFPEGIFFPFCHRSSCPTHRPMSHVLCPPRPRIQASIPSPATGALLSLNPSVPLIRPLRFLHPTPPLKVESLPSLSHCGTEQKQSVSRLSVWRLILLLCLLLFSSLS